MSFALAEMLILRFSGFFLKTSAGHYMLAPISVTTTSFEGCRTVQKKRHHRMSIFLF